MTEIKTKLEKLRALMAQHQIQGLRLKGVDWFSWMTGGGSSVVIFTSESGIAEVFITATDAWILTNRIERDRLVQEELPAEFEVVAFAWEEPSAADSFIAAKLGSGICFSDRPSQQEKSMPLAFQKLKMILSPEEIIRYRQVGKLAAEAMTEAMQLAKPDWSEDRLAGEGAKALWSRGLDPTLVMVGGEKRVQIYRHPIATQSPLGDFAMMVFCARGFGLYANLTRFIFFREPTKSERQQFLKVAQVEATIFDNSREGQSLSSIYQVMKEAYSHIGAAEEIHKHHQGGPTGYLSRELLALPGANKEARIENNMALAWNPSLPGCKIEDTVLTTDDGVEILTVDDKWPSLEISGRLRPDVWVKEAAK